MKDIIALRKSEILIRSVVSLIILLTLTVSLYFGFRLTSFEGCTIIPKPVLDKNSIWDDLGILCISDLLGIWLLAIPSSRMNALAISAIVLAFRGLVIGNAVRIFFTNTVPTYTVLILISYCIVTLIMISFVIFLRGHVYSSGKAVRILSSVLISGACAIIRVIPYLFIK